MHQSMLQLGTSGQTQLKFFKNDRSIYRRKRAAPSYQPQPGLLFQLVRWTTFLQRWNGVGMLSNLGHHIPQATVTSDVSGRWGCAAQTGSNSHGRVDGRGAHNHQCLCDNAAVVKIIKSGSSKASIVNALDEVTVLHLSSLQVHFCR